MTSVKVVVYMTLPKELGWKVKYIQFDKEKPTIRDLFNKLKELKNVRKKYLDRGWDLVVLLNGRHIEFLNNEETILKDGDEVAIFPPAAGG